MALQAGTVLVFGVDTPTKTYGIVQTASTDSNVRRALAIAPDGSTVSIQEFAEQKNLTLTYLPLGTASTEPTIGTPFTYEGLIWQIDNHVDTRTVDGFAEVTIDAQYYPKIH